MHLYFVRHGESEANVLRVISNRGRVHPLTERGRAQTVDLAERLRPVGVTRIYTSPLLRAVQTAEILSATLDVPYEITDALREYDCGVIEGRSDPESWAQHRAQRDEWLIRRRWKTRIEGGESFLDMERRFAPFVRGLAGDVAQRSGECIVLVGHGGLYACMLPLVLANVDFDRSADLPFPNTGYVLAETGPRGLTCLEWCGVAIGSGNEG
jgi:probable phosphoglycerate mutase